MVFTADQLAFKFTECVPNASGSAFAMLEKALSSFWLPSKIISMTKDRASYRDLTDSKKRLMRTQLAFFLFSDRKVIDLIADSITPDLAPELFVEGTDMENIFSFLDLQRVMELVHAHTYKALWEGIIPPEEARSVDFSEMAGVIAKIEHMMRYADKSLPFAERLFGWHLAEGLFFQEIFGGIFYFEEPSFPGLWQSNKLIARDENLHTEFTRDELYLKLREPLSEERVHEIARDYMQTSRIFCQDMLPEPVPGLSAQMLYTYAQFRCDQLLQKMKYAPLYDVKNPLLYMKETALSESTNFFELPEMYQHGDMPLSVHKEEETAETDGSLSSSSGIFCSVEELWK